MIGALGRVIALPPEQLRENAAAALRAAVDGVLTPAFTTYPLDEAARAHEDLEARRTTGSQVLRIQADGDPKQPG